MFRLKTAVMAAVLLTLAAVEALATTAAPLMVVFEACPTGSKRKYPFVLYEDRDGNGFYDYVIAGNCDGSTIGRPMSSIQGNPFTPTTEDVPLATLAPNTQADSVAVTYELGTGGTWYAWTVTEYSEGLVICTHARTSPSSLSSSCGGGGLGMLGPER